MATGYMGASGTCYPSPEGVDGGPGAEAAALDFIAAHGTKVVSQGACVYEFQLAGDYIDGYAWQRRVLAGDPGQCTGNDWNDPSTWLHSGYSPPSCEVISSAEALEVSWLVVGAWLLVYFVKWLRRAV